MAARVEQEKVKMRVMDSFELALIIKAHLISTFKDWQGIKFEISEISSLPDRKWSIDLYCECENEDLESKIHTYIDGFTDSWKFFSDNIQEKEV